MLDSFGVLHNKDLSAGKIRGLRKKKKKKTERERERERETRAHTWNDIVCFNLLQIRPSLPAASYACLHTLEHRGAKETWIFWHNTPGNRNTQIKHTSLSFFFFLVFFFPDLLILRARKDTDTLLAPSEPLLRSSMRAVAKATIHKTSAKHCRLFC